MLQCWYFYFSVWWWWWWWGWQWWRTLSHIDAQEPIYGKKCLWEFGLAPSWWRSWWRSAWWREPQQIVENSLLRFRSLLQPFSFLMKISISSVGKYQKIWVWTPLDGWIYYRVLVFPPLDNDCAGYVACSVLTHPDMRGKKRISQYGIVSTWWDCDWDVLSMQWGLFDLQKVSSFWLFFVITIYEQPKCLIWVAHPPLTNFHDWGYFQSVSFS